MAYQSDVVTSNDVKPSNVPTAKQARSIIPRITADMTQQMGGQTTAALHQLADTFDKEVADLERTVRNSNLSDAGREYTVNERRAAFEAFTQVQVDAHTKAAREHAAQLEAELSMVPAPDNFFVISQIWKRLDSMSASDVDALLTQSNDPQLVSAVFSAPAIFQYGSEGARQRLLFNYNKATRPERLALLDDARTFIEAIANYRDMLVRRFKEIAK
jgi:hypothetical protein